MKLDKAYTKEEINSTGIYKITNTVNKKAYIGSSSCLRMRKNQHSRELRKNIHTNKKLQNSVNKYGFNNFVFSIVEFCEKSQVRFREQYYLNKYKPQLNISSKAEALMCPDIQEKRDAKLRKRYYLINPEGIQMCTNNLKGFCEDHNIKRDNIAHLLVKGNSACKYYKGWYITTDPTELKEENRYTKEKWSEDNVDTFREARAKYITYIWNIKTDQAFIIGDILNATHLTLHSFCEEFNLTKESIRTAFNKGKNNYKHFVIYRQYKNLTQPSASFLNNYYLQHKDFKVRKQRACLYIYAAISPEGKSYKITKDTKGFCEKHNLDSSSFLKVARGKLKSVKGWKVTRQN